MLLKGKIPLKYIFGKVRMELIATTLFATVVAVLYEQFHLWRLSIPLSIPMIMGTVISLLLAFRSNQAYDRWWEARTIWGAIVNDSRTLARQIKTLSRETYHGEDLFFFRQRFIKRQIAWCYCLSRNLRGQECTAGFDAYLGKKELQYIGHYSSPPMALLELHANDLKMALENNWINDYQQVEMDKTLTRLTDAMGKCERIKNTVFPATYSLYIHFSLIIFFILLPFALIEFFGIMWYVPTMVAIATVFFLVEKMAIHLQDPFENKPTDTPMTAICATIERDLKQVINESVTEQKPVRNGYYVM